MAAKIRVRWPEGAICGICFTNALHITGTCTLCGHEGLLPGRHDGADVCRSCAGISTNMTCDGCGVEAERFRSGHCIRCVLHADLSSVLQPHTPPDLRLKRLINILVETDRPESIYTWKRSKAANGLLAGLGARDISLTHLAFDALPQSKGVEFVRELLVHHSILPERDRHLATFERWLDTRLENLSTTASVERPIGQFGRWHHLRRLRTMSQPGKNLSAATRSAKQEITEASKFVTWLHEEHRIGFPDCRQAHIEDYLSSGPSTRQLIRTFIVWHLKAGTVSRLAVPHRYSERKPLITQPRRLELINHCITATRVAKSPRVAGLILLLYAQPIIKIVGLKTTDLIARPDGLYLKLGTTPALIPEQVSELFWNYLRDRPNQQTGNKNSAWLFPSTIAGQHMHVDSLKDKLRTLGIDLAAARNATLRDLVSELPPTLVAQALGYSAKVIHLHAADAAVPMAGYISAKTHFSSEPRS
ncbi:MAG: site-specific recombinase [Kineosporiaceae bacterium]|nr:site-specific recombinase [Aeromicrobium sp.]